MDQKRIVKNTAAYIQKEFTGESTGHDWWHIHRVWKDSVELAKKEGCDLFIVEMAALLHDLSDFKFNTKKEGEDKIVNWLKSQGLSREDTDKILEIVDDISFKGAKSESKVRSMESAVIQDADRLDAIGAVGIARVFAYGGKAGRAIYDPNIKPTMHKSFEEYKNNNSSSVNHFYEKLLLLKDRMNTDSAKKIATNRHKFMEQFLDEFYREWEGKS